MLFIYWNAHAFKNNMLKSQSDRFILDQITKDTG